MYFLAIHFLRRSSSPDEMLKISSQHARWTSHKAAEGIIAQSGKWGDDGSMAIFRAESLAEAEEVLREDPLISAGVADYVVKPFSPEIRQDLA